MVMRWPSGLLSAKRGQHMSQPVELRDILRLFWRQRVWGAAEYRRAQSAFAGAPARAKAGVKSIDLEHNVCYSPENHWNALTDGRSKYIFHARDGEEQLFDLAKDPQELKDLAGDTAHAGDVRKWRSRMLQHLSERGDEFVKGGTLALRPKGKATSPKFPGYAA